MSKLIELLDDMSTYSLEEVLLRWKQGRLTVEQVVGYLIQHVAEQEVSIQQLQRERRK